MSRCVTGDSGHTEELVELMIGHCQPGGVAEIPLVEPKRVGVLEVEQPPPIYCRQNGVCIELRLYTHSLEVGRAHKHCY